MGRGCTPTPFHSIYNHVQSCSGYAPAERADTLTLFHLYCYVLCAKTLVEPCANVKYLVLPMWVKIGENIHPLESNVSVEHYSVGVEPLPMESVVRVRARARVRVTKNKHIRIMDKILY